MFRSIIQGITHIKKLPAFLLVAIVLVAPAPIRAFAQGPDTQDIPAVDSTQEESGILLTLPTAEEVETVYQHIAEYQRNGLIEGAVGYEYEWTVFGLARGGALDQGTRESYVNNVAEYLKSCNGDLGSSYHTNYSRVILALTSLGYDASDFVGYDLTAPLAELENTSAQGINGSIYALIALDSGAYDIPQLNSAVQQTQATRELYLEEILSVENPEGGWGLTVGSVSADVTAMVLQAFAPYCGEGYAGIDEAVERGIAALADMQNDDGGFGGGDTANAESCAQVMIALNALDISLDDTRFIKNGRNLYDAFMTFYDPSTGGVSHVAGEPSDSLASTQGTYMLNSLHRSLAGQNRLYDMTDLELSIYHGTSPDASMSPVQISVLIAAVIVVSALALFAITRAAKRRKHHHKQ